jgi:glycosyltransferase involved in cell wall biosynthesis
MRIGILMALESPWARETTIRLAECGLEVHALTFSVQHKESDLDILNGSGENSNALLRKHAVTVHHIKTRLNSDLRYVSCRRTLRTICVQNSIDVLLLLGGGGFAAAAFFSGYRPYVLYTVGSDVLLTRGLRQLINRVTYRAAELIFANGIYLGDRTRALTGRSDVRSLYLGIDTNRFTPSENVRRTTGILCSRPFSAIYNNEYLLDGLAELGSQATYDEVVFTSAGPDISQARSKAAALPASIARRIRFLGGVSDKEMLTNLHRASIYVSLSSSDGTSISLLEALACGLFPVVSDIPQNREWIDPDLKNGFLVPLGRPKELAKALEQALNEKTLRERAARKNRQIILDRADARKNMTKLVSELNQIDRTKHL